ncbi:MAG: ABC transporter permease, partial [Hyphomicrobiales bacterium]
MSKVALLSLQLIVAVVSLGAWYVLTTVPIGGTTLLPPFFFSNPVDVAARVVKWFADGTIWK